MHYLGVCLGLRVGLPHQLHSASQPPHCIDLDAGRARWHADGRSASLHSQQKPTQAAEAFARQEAEDMLQPQGCLADPGSSVLLHATGDGAGSGKMF